MRTRGQPRPIPQLQDLARDLVGDSLSPDLFFVCDGSSVVMVARNFDAAYQEWRRLSRKYPVRECALESRRVGVLASVELVEGRALVHDDTDWMSKKGWCPKKE